LNSQQQQKLLAKTKNLNSCNCNSHIMNSWPTLFINRSVHLSIFVLSFYLCFSLFVLSFYLCFSIFVLSFYLCFSLFVLSFYLCFSLFVLSFYLCFSLFVLSFYLRFSLFLFLIFLSNATGSWKVISHRDVSKEQVSKKEKKKEKSKKDKSLQLFRGQGKNKERKRIRKMRVLPTTTFTKNLVRLLHPCTSAVMNKDCKLFFKSIFFCLWLTFCRLLHSSKHFYLN